MSWEAAEQKKDEAAQDENEGYWLSMQVLTKFWQLFTVINFVLYLNRCPIYSISLLGEKQQEDGNPGLDGRDQQEGEVHQEARQQALLCLQVDFLDMMNFTLATIAS